MRSAPAEHSVLRTAVERGDGGERPAKMRRVEGVAPLLSHEAHTVMAAWWPRVAGYLVAAALQTAGETAARPAAKPHLVLYGAHS